VPSLDADDDLLAEGADPHRVHLVGNVMVEALLTHVDVTRERPVIEWLGRVRGDAAS
jgi:UDP-N-acetylglucosamine 2-epimerase (non-hydrolysing)